MIKDFYVRDPLETDRPCPHLMDCEHDDAPDQETCGLYDDGECHHCKGDLNNRPEWCGLLDLKQIAMVAKEMMGR